MWQADMLLHFVCEALFVVVWPCFQLNFNIFQPEFQCSVRLAKFVKRTLAISLAFIQQLCELACVRVCGFKFVEQMTSRYFIKWRNYQHYSKFPTNLSLPHNELSFQYGIPFTSSDERASKQQKGIGKKGKRERERVKAHLLCRSIV